MTEQQDMASRLRSARAAAGLSQENVACALGIARTAISDIETGRRKVSALELRGLATLYHRDVSWLVGEEPQESVHEVAQRVLAGLDSNDARLVLRFAQFLAAGGAR